MNPGLVCGETQWLAGVSNLHVSARIWAPRSQQEDTRNIINQRKRAEFLQVDGRAKALLQPPVMAAHLHPPFPTQILLTVGHTSSSATQSSVPCSQASPSLYWELFSTCHYLPPRWENKCTGGNGVLSYKPYLAWIPMFQHPVLELFLQS